MGGVFEIVVPTQCLNYIYICYIYPRGVYIVFESDLGVYIARRRRKIFGVYIVFLGIFGGIYSVFRGYI